MKTPIFSLWILFAVNSVPLWAQAPVFQLSLTLEPWVRSCVETKSDSALSCQIPKPFSSSDKISLQTQLSFPETEGHAHHVTLPFFSTDEKIKGEARLYAVTPRASQKQPQYVQIQVEMSHPVRSLCTQTVRLKTPMEFPLFACTGLEASLTNKKLLYQYGLNVWVKVL